MKNLHTSLNVDFSNLHQTGLDGGTVFLNIFAGAGSFIHQGGTLLGSLSDLGNESKLRREKQESIKR